MINLNEERFNGKENAIKVFNNGNAGEVVVKVRVEKKKPEDNPQSPDWKLYWSEENGTEINSGYYYLDSNREGYEKRLNIEGRILKDILKALHGDTITLPIFPTYNEILDNSMQMIAMKSDKFVKIGVTYGTVKWPNKRGYLQLKNSFPFITGNLDEEILFNWNYDLEHRQQSDSEVKTETPTENAPW